MSASMTKGLGSWWAPVLVGMGVVCLALLCAGRELHQGIVHWERLGPLPPGGPTPAFEVLTLDGGRFGPAELEGKVSVLTFWATWCGACKSELDDLDELQHEYDGQSVQFLAINHDGGGLSPLEAAARVQGFARQRGMTLPTALDDGQASRSFRVGPIPHTLVVGPDGVVRHVHQGRVLSETLREEISELLP
ncbi:TlpA family protein disulfide reductase [Paraliomyxa miuraensis]|uniref:TlpA family protein disulfide reductase n=1 Tax=Paraliomyxa miuraensis TaxID=376150 RepID=UPI0022581389|nr:TlpA disulfide reductase family protein [Paraliomyxa miuraensis]MCX4239878.1 TlpA family protein disulfide reductase [Paraliomyxa miuraensis]